jgi:hypothetical protein
MWSISVPVQVSLSRLAVPFRVLSGHTGGGDDGAVIANTPVLGLIMPVKPFALLTDVPVCVQYWTTGGRMVKFVACTHHAPVISTAALTTDGTETIAAAVTRTNQWDRRVMCSPPCENRTTAKSTATSLDEQGE